MIMITLSLPCQSFLTQCIGIPLRELWNVGREEAREGGREGERDRDRQTDRQTDGEAQAGRQEGR